MAPTRAWGVNANPSSAGPVAARAPVISGAGPVQQIAVPPWEARLLALAHEALTSHDVPPRAAACAGRMAAAHAVCAGITRRSSRTFHLASALLPPAKRRGVRALYAFCRTADDLVDRAADAEPAAVRAALADLQRRMLADHPPPGDLVALAWADTRARFGVPRAYGEQLIAGVARDLEPVRYRTFDDLTGYCYGAASTVGLMAMYIVGYRDVSAVPYAVRLGVALQLTNILRDVGEDWRAGRLYLPLDDLADFGLGEADVAAGRPDGRWRRFVGFQIARTRQLYAAAQPGIGLLAPDGRFAIAAAADLYGAILTDIEAAGGDVFHRRAHVSSAAKLRRLPALWWRSRRPWPTLPHEEFARP